jgi:hypothetical protein
MDLTIADLQIGQQYHNISGSSMGYDIESYRAITCVVTPIGAPQIDGSTICIRVRILRLGDEAGYTLKVGDEVTLHHGIFRAM